MSPVCVMSYLCLVSIFILHRSRYNLRYSSLGVDVNLAGYVREKLGNLVDQWLQIGSGSLYGIPNCGQDSS